MDLRFHYQVAEVVDLDTLNRPVLVDTDISVALRARLRARRGVVTRGNEETTATLFALEAAVALACCHVTRLPAVFNAVTTSTTREVSGVCSR